MITLTGAEAELLEQAVINAGPIYDSDGIQPVVEGIIAARLVELAQSSRSKTERLRTAREQVARHPQMVYDFDAYLLGFLSASVPDDAWDRGLDAAIAYVGQGAATS